MSPSLTNNKVYLYKTISNNAIAAYVVALFAVSVYFMKHSTAWYFMLFGVLEVVGFYYYGNVLSKQYIKYTEKTFAKKIFVTAFIVRIIYVLFSYWFYDFMTGNPFEFGAADSLFYHDAALDVSKMISRGQYNFLSVLNEWGGVELSDSGYVIYLGFVYWLFFDSILVARLLKALMSAYMCVLIYKLAKRNFGESVGRLAAVLALLCPHFIYYCGLQLKETEMIFVAVLALEKFDAVFRGGKITLKNVSVAVFDVSACIHNENSTWHFINVCRGGECVVERQIGYQYLKKMDCLNSACYSCRYIFMESHCARNRRNVGSKNWTKGQYGMACSTQQRK